MRRLTKGYAAGLALAAASVLGACTTPPATDPPASPSTQGLPTSSTTSGTAAPTTTATGPSSTTGGGHSQLPEAAKANTPQGAEAFTRYFGAVLDESFATLDSSALSTVTLPDCKSCAGAISAIDGYRQRGERFLGQYAGFSTAVFVSTTDGVTRVLTHSETTGAKVVNAQGSTVRTIPAQSGDLSIQLKFDGQWRVAEAQGVA